MLFLAKKWSKTKEIIEKFYKLMFMSSFEIEIAFRCLSESEDCFLYFEQVSKIIHDKFVKCEVGKQGEFIARYRTRFKDRENATLEAQKISNSFLKNLNPDRFTINYYKVE